MSTGRDNRRRRIERIRERDGALCWLCGRALDWTLRKGRYPGITLDHVVPRSLGGTGVLSNLKLAHRICNTVRGNGIPDGRVDPERCYAKACIHRRYGESRFCEAHARGHAAVKLAGFLRACCR